MELSRRRSLATLKMTWLAGLTRGIQYLQAFQQQLDLIGRCCTANMKSSRCAFGTWHKTLLNCYIKHFWSFFWVVLQWSWHKYNTLVGMVKCLQGDVKTPDNGSHKQSVESVDADVRARKRNSQAERKLRRCNPTMSCRSNIYKYQQVLSDDMSTYVRKYPSAKDI